MSVLLSTSFRKRRRVCSHLLPLIQCMAETRRSFIKIMQEAGENIAPTVTKQPIPTPGLHVRRAIVEAAHKHGVISVAHTMNYGDTQVVLEAGVDGVAHAVIDQLLTQALVEAYKRSGAFLVPTLIGHASNTGEESHSREHFAHDLETAEMEFLCEASKEGIKCPVRIRAGQGLQSSRRRCRMVSASLFRLRKN